MWLTSGVPPSTGVTRMDNAFVGTLYCLMTLLIEAGNPFALARLVPTSKAAAHAIPKVYRLDKSRVEELVEIVETMLRDSTPFVLSSAAAAFTEVCPHRIDLIHRHFRKICRMLVDVDEWGQILLANLLLRYARSQFLRPDAYPRELDPAAAANPEGGEKTLALALPASSGGAFEKPSENPLGSTAGFYSDSSSDDSSDSGSDDSDKKGSGAKKDGGKKKKAPRASAAQAARGCSSRNSRPRSRE